MTHCEGIVTYVKAVKSQNSERMTARPFVLQQMWCVCVCVCAQVTITRKHADPREPITTKLDVPNCPPDETLAVQGPVIIANKRPVQSIAFAPWPYTPEQVSMRALQPASVPLNHGAIEEKLIQLTDNELERLKV